MQNSEILRTVIRSFLLVVSRKTSQDFTIKSMRYILDKHKTQYGFLEFISIDIDPKNGLIAIEVENSLALRYANLKKISDFLEIVFIEVFREIVQSEYYYNTDLHDLVEDVMEDIGPLLRKLGIKIQWNRIIRGASVKTSGIKADISLKDKYKKSDILKPLINSLVDLLYDGMLKKGKKRKDAVFLIVNVIRDLERKYPLFKFMLLEDIDKEKMDYAIKTQWKIEDVFFFDSDDQYAIKAVSKIDEIDDELYKKAITEFILNIGSYINVQDKPFYVERLKSMIDDNCLKSFVEIGVDFDEMEEIFRKQGYNFIIKKTLDAIIEIVSAKTSVNYAIVALDSIFEKIKDMPDAEMLRFIHIDKNKSEEGKKAIKIDSDVNNQDPYKIAKTMRQILRKVQENQSSYADKASFINDLKIEMGERFFLELEKMGVNVNIISMRYV